MPRTPGEYYGTYMDTPPLTPYAPARPRWQRLAEGGWKVAQKTIGKYLKDKEYAERMRRIKQGGEIENQRLADASSKKNMPRNVQNKLVTRTAMKVTGKLKVKKQKEVHVSKKFKQGVKQVLAGTQAKGTYVVVKNGMVGSVLDQSAGTDPAPALTLIGTALTLGQPYALYGRVGFPGGQRTWWNGMANWILGSATTIRDFTDFNFFTPAKILDAASVLFNNKAPSTNYATGNNLSTVFTSATGAPVITQIGQLKINVLKSYCEFQIKNVSNRVVRMTIYECTPKLKFQPATSLQALNLCNTLIDEPTENANVGYYISGSGNVQSSLMLDESVDVVALARSKLGYQFNYKKRDMVLAPDETCVHTVVGPKGVLDFSKLYSSDPTTGTPNLQLNPLCKGWSVSCMISINGDQILNVAGGKFAFSAPTAAENARMGMPVAIQTKESYSVSVPEIAGFVTTAGLAGSRQQLNLRKPKYVLSNQCQIQPINFVPAISNEVNPIAEAATVQVG